MLVFEIRKGTLIVRLMVSKILLLLLQSAESTSFPKRPFCKQRNHSSIENKAYWSSSGAPEKIATIDDVPDADLQDTLRALQQADTEDSFVTLVTAFPQR